MSQFPQLNEVNEKNPLVTVHTNLGDFTLELFLEVAPKTVENFVTHAKTQLELVWVASLFTDVLSKMNFQEKHSTCMELYQWQMQVQTQMDLNSSLLQQNKYPHKC